MVIFLIVFLIIVVIVIYMILKDKRFKENLSVVLSKNGFSKSYKIYDLEGSGIHLVKDVNENRFCVINENSPKFITNIFKGFSIDHSASDKKTLIAVDNTTKEVCFVHKVNGEPEIKFYDGKDIISSEVVVKTNSVTKTVTKTNRGSQIVGAAAGGLLLGPAGLIVGGVTGSKRSKGKTTNYVNKIELIITVNDIQYPIQTISFLSSSTEERGIIYEDAIKRAELWNGIFKVIINSTNK